MSTDKNTDKNTEETPDENPEEIPEENTDETPGKIKRKITDRRFGDIARWVEPGSPEHLSMMHSHLRGLTHQKHVQSAEKESVSSSSPDLDNLQTPKQE